MNHYNVEKVVVLLKRRAEAEALIRAAAEGSMDNCVLYFGGEKFEVRPDLVPRDNIRQTIIEAAYDVLYATDRDLHSLGVSTPTLPKRLETLEQWKQKAEMYLRVWIRELGGKLRQKPHLIDALAITTAEMRNKAEQYSSDPVIDAGYHSRRVTELLEHANKLEERARSAERKLKEYLAGSPAEKLAFAVAQAAAETIASLTPSQRSS